MASRYSSPTGEWQNQLNFACRKLASMAEHHGMNIKLIRAFIASPGGLAEEREAAFEAAKEVNRSVAIPLGGRLELYGWEETLSGNGRPQAIINAEMAKCELFIGAMWTSWGSRPSANGPYTSGFEEEFELSRKRYAETQAPAMAMYFKAIDAMQLRDPGQELAKVLAFQETLRSTRELLYGNFNDAQDFAAKVRQFLSTHTIRLLTEEALVEEKPERAARPVTAEEDGHAARTVSIRPDVKEAGFLVSTAEAMCGDETLAAENVARLRLISATAANAGNDRIILGVHDANLLYVHRDKFAFSELELEGLVASGLSELAHENTPLWSWLKEASAERPDMLEALTVFASTEVQVGALHALRILRHPIEQLTFVSDHLVEHFWLHPASKSAVRAMALRYLREFGRLVDIPMIDAEAERGDSDTLTLARQAVTAIWLREDEQEAARYLLASSFESFDPDLLAQALPFLDSLDSVELSAALDHRSSKIRAQAISILSRRGLLELDTIGRAKEDDAAAVRYAALLASDRAGQVSSLEEAKKVLTYSKRTVLLFTRSTDSSGLPYFEEYRDARMRQMPAAALEALIAVSEHRDAAYRILASRRISNYGELIRANLEAGYEAYFAEHWPEGIPPDNSTALAALMLPTNSDGSKKRELVRKALDVVTDQRDPKDLDLVRAVIDVCESAPTASVIAYLKALGGPEDISRLAMTPAFVRLRSDGDYNKDFNEAARLILKFSKGAFADLLDEPMAEVMKSRLIDMVSATEFAALTNERILMLLQGAGDDIRRAAAKKIPACLPKSRIKKILERYRSSEDGRYYVVPHWLDLGLAYSKPVARDVGLAAG